MKRTLLIFLMIAFAIISSETKAQPWNSLLPTDKLESGELSFFEIRDAFNDYWSDKDVVDGYYFINGVKTKAGGWKQFKRWEWYWENRVNPTTGEFPNSSAWEEYQKIKKSLGNQRSPSGQWTSMGPNTSPGGYAGLGRLNCIGFHPTDNNTLYVGAAAGGVWKTTDGGSTWIPQSDDIDAIGISDIVVLTTAGNDIVYIATGDRDHSDTYSVGVLKSTDGGSTWQNTGLIFTVGQKRLIYRLLVDPINNNIFYAATSVGVYKSNDSGANWSVLTSNVYIDMEFKPGATNIIYGGTKQGNIDKTTDSGVNWSNSFSSSGKRTELAVSTNDATIVYAVVAASNNGLFGVYKSTDSGSSFSLVYNSNNLLGWSCDGSDSGGQGWYDLCIVADPTNADEVFLGGVNTWKSTNGGTSWNINTHWSNNCGGNATTTHADKHNLTYQNGTSTLWECNDGGLYSTSNGGSNWSHHTDGMVISQMYRLGVAQTTAADVITGLQDNGTKALLSSTWNDVLGGDGMECLIDYSDENVQYGSLYYGSIYRTTDHWVNSIPIDGGISGNASWVTPYVQDPNNSNTLYVGFQDVWKSPDQGNSWTQLSSWSGNTLRSLAVAPSNSNYIYAATTYTLYGTSNGGTSWNDITGSLPTGASNIMYISVKVDDPNTMWIAMGEFNNNCVYESTNGGTSWTDISAGLPSLPTSCVIQNRQNTTQTELYAATDVGVYLKLGSANWTPFFNNMPNVVVTELDIYYDDVVTTNSMIRASTFGRGLWESDLHSATTTLSADFYANNTNVQLGDNVIFTDISTGSPTSWVWTFAGGTPGTHNGQTPPAIQYNTTGSWDVTLVVSDGTNTESTTKTNYISVTDCNVTTFPFSEDFENGGTIPDCWSQEYISGSNVDWQYITGNGDSNPALAHSGAYNACFKDEDTDEDKTMLVTPPLDMSSFASGQVSFWHTQEFWSPDQDELKIYYRVDATSSWVLLQSYTGNISTWTKDSVTLTNLSSTYYIGFEGNAKYGHGVCLDDVEITGSTDLITANFTGDPTTGTLPLTVNFTDISAGTIDSWDWDFGDGNISTEQNPTNIYSDAGLYTVSLTITGPSGSDSETKTDYIEVNYPAPITDFQGIPTSGNIPLTVSFTDLSSGNIDTWNWDFGDGTTSTDQNPEHIYTTAGTYSVTLIIEGPGGIDTLEKTEYIFVTELIPVADFEGTPTTGQAPLLVSFTDLSIGNIDTWDWKFGDGETSTNQNPSHEYQSSGNFTVTLEITGPGGIGSEVKTDYILIPVGIDEETTEAIIVYPNPVKEIMNIVLPNSGNRKFSLKNMAGELVYSVNSNEELVTINIRNFTSGIYTLVISGDNSTSVSKVIIE
jgi:PKD repeat protein